MFTINSLSTNCETRFPDNVEHRVSPKCLEDKLHLDSCLPFQKPLKSTAKKKKKSKKV